MNYTEKEYRSLNRFANSDLSEFKRLLIGDTRPLPTAAFNFGSVVHELLLEPENLTYKRWSEEVTDAERERMMGIYDSVRKHPFITEMIATSEREQVHFFEVDGMPCKAKIDLKREKLVADIKTTSSRSMAAFRAAIRKFDYNRQAAYYLDAAEGEEFVFIGLQKHAPFEVFYVEVESESIEQGRREYHQLLKQIKSVNFIPSAWELEKVTV